jgi:hypothetical protein
MRLRVLAVAAVITAALSLVATTALAAAHGPQPASRPPAGPRHVRVLVLTMFSGKRSRGLTTSSCRSRSSCPAPTARFIAARAACA